KWEALVVEDVDRTLRTAGLLGVSPADSRVGSHDLIGLSIILVSIAELFTSFFLGFSGSLVLIYLTVGAFSLGWIDLTIHEPRSHFRSHLQVEDAVARVLPNIAGVKGGVS
ncbi:MAG TPA: hypothetical protein VFE96_01720, partial [Candidatus Bathyarchaeia archaeon]|nr:hypothetical protein [Candidatus Bathyarchaeia archaeon]